MTKTKRQEMKIAGKSNVNNTASSIVKYHEDGVEVELISVGAGALNQATKAIAAASGILATKGYEVLVKVGFTTVKIDDEDKTAMRQILVIK